MNNSCIMMKNIILGDIPIGHHCLNSLKSTKRAGFLNKHFKQRSQVKKLLTETRRVKIDALMKLQKSMAGLLER